MTKILKSFWTYLVLVNLLACLAAADDVYNFYFQKAPGPKTVIQGGSPQKPDSEDEIEKDQAESNDQVAPKDSGDPTASQTAGVATVPSSSTPASVTAQTEGQSEPRWGIELGYAEQVNFFKYTGYGASVKYNFNKYFGIKVGMIWTTMHKDYRTGAGNDDNGVDGQLALSYEPIHLFNLGHDVFTLGIQGGVMSMRDYAFDRSRRARLFVGGLTNINLFRNFGFFGDYKIALGESRQKENSSSQDFYEAQLNAGISIRF